MSEAIVTRESCPHSARCQPDSVVGDARACRSNQSPYFSRVTPLSVSRRYELECDHVATDDWTKEHVRSTALSGERSLAADSESVCYTLPAAAIEANQPSCASKARVWHRWLACNGRTWAGGIRSLAHRRVLPVGGIRRITPIAQVEESLMCLLWLCIDYCPPEYTLRDHII